MQTVLEQGSIDKPLTFDVGLIQLQSDHLIHATFQSNCAEGLHFSAFHLYLLFVHACVHVSWIVVCQLLYIRIIIANCECYNLVHLTHLIFLQVYYYRKYSPLQQACCSHDIIIISYLLNTSSNGSTYNYTQFRDPQVCSNTFVSFDTTTLTDQFIPFH